MTKFRKSTQLAAAVVSGLLAAAALPIATASATTATTAAASTPASAASATDAARVPDRYLHQQLDWQPCASGALECAPMSVPRDWHHPGDGQSLTVEVSRHRATSSSERRGVLMVAAGGPGASGLKRPAALAGYSPKLAAAYDIVGFDQRGVGSSTNVVCSDQQTVDAFFHDDLRDRTPQAIRQTFARARGFVRDCEQNSGGLLPYITTDQAVHDMDLYRALLGVDTFTYYGPSYATFLGAYYATEFPGRLDRIVLDSNVDFTGSWQSFLEGQPMGFQRRFEQDFLPWLAANDATYHRGDTPAAAQASFESLRRALHDHPLDLDGTTITANHLDVATSSAMYNADQFESLASTLNVLEHPDTASPAARQAIAEALKHPMGANFFADFFSVTCNDTPWTRDPLYWVAESDEATRDHPLAGARELTFASICAAWPHSSAPHVQVTGQGLPAVLMLNSVHDPATYYESALRAHQGLPGSRLVTVTDGGDHVQYQNGNACVDAIVEGYLLGGTVPAGDTTCEAEPLPVPTATP